MARDSRRLRDALSPTVLDRLRTPPRPDWTRTVVGRRIAAGLLTVLALILAVRGDPGGEPVPVVAASRELAPGIALTEADLRVTRIPAEAVPEGATRDVGDVVGRTLTAPARPGEPITDARTLGSRLAELTAGPDARIVPLHIADSDVAGLLRSGDRVDILTVDAEGATAPRILATDAAVVLATSADSGRNSSEGAVLVALPQADATSVAAASMTGAITVTLH